MEWKLELERGGVAMAFEGERDDDNGEHKVAGANRGRVQRQRSKEKAHPLVSATVGRASGLPGR